jgi:hypothetical protein
MMQNARFSPNLYTTACQFYEMFLVTSKREHQIFPIVTGKLSNKKRIDTKLRVNKQNIYP